jgi:glycosyltransferase involved in cell wall biosynthesis
MVLLLLQVKIERERKLLCDHGHEVAVLTRHSDEIRSYGFLGACRGALATIWNPWMARAVRKKVDLFRPHVVHVHNMFPLISPSIFSAIGTRAKRVLTLHNYRAVCPAAIPMRHGKVCTLCIDKKCVWSAIRYGCYRNSRVATVPLAMNVALHRTLRTWQNQVDAFIVLSDFQRHMMENAGFPKGKMFVKPNFLLGSPRIKAWIDKEPAIVFVGRLSEEKGIRTLISAWKLWKKNAPELRVIGDGPLRDTLTMQSKDLPVRFLGHLCSQETQREIAKAKLIVVPSECYETFGMVVIEAFAHGTPVAVSSLGALPYIVQDGITGVVFPPADPRELLDKVSECWVDDTRLAKMGIAARSQFEKMYTEEINYQQLMAIYEKTIKGI